MRSNRRHFPILLVFIIALIFGGCASYTTQSLDLNREHPLRVTYNSENFQITVLPIITKEDGKRVFDRDDLNRKGLIPIYVSISNLGSNSIVIKSVSLIDSLGNSYKQLTPTEAAESVKKSLVGRAAAWFLLSPIAAVASAAHTSSVNERIVNDLVEKQFKMTPISPREMRSGYVYFEVNEKTNSLDGFKLLIEIDGKDKTRVELPLKGEITGK